MDKQQSLATVDDRTPPIITTPDQYRQALGGWQQRGFHILTPFTHFSGLAERHGIVTTIVQLNLDASYGDQTNGGEVYGGAPWLKGGKRGEPTEELAITKTGLRRIARAGEVSTRAERTDTRLIPHYWEMRGLISYRGIDGTIVTHEAMLEWDLRDGSERIRGWQTNQKLEGRKHGLRNCDARVVNAALRELGLKQKYTRAELERPFIVVKVIYQPDMSDPLVRQIVTERAIAGTSALYAPRALPVGASEVLDVEPVDAAAPKHVGSGTSADASAPAADEPPTEYAVRIVDVKPHGGTSPGGRAWTRYVVTDSNGVMASTFDRSIADAAIEAQRSKAWVEVTTVTENGHTNITEIAPAGQQPSLLSAMKL